MQYDAALFLINNMSTHYSEDNIGLDKNGNEVSFKVTNYKDIQAATVGFNQLRENLGVHANLQLESRR